jgi:molecular chaperone GrpE (heat shock protein)
MKENTGTATLRVAKEKYYTIDSNKIKTIKSLLEVMDAFKIVLKVNEDDDTYNELIDKGLLKEVV